ncbi:hypothetical protein NKG94_21750 [Micromonospora sp. M12]
MVPLARIMADTALIDTYPGLILVYVAQFLPFTVFLMTSYYRAFRRRSSTPRGSTATPCTAFTAGSCCPWAPRRCCRSASSTRCSAGTTCSWRW